MLIQMKTNESYFHSTIEGQDFLDFYLQTFTDETQPLITASQLAKALAADEFSDGVKLKATDALRDMLNVLADLDKTPEGLKSLEIWHDFSQNVDATATFELLEVRRTGKISWRLPHVDGKSSFIMSATQLAKFLLLPLREHFAEEASHLIDPIRYYAEEWQLHNMQWNEATGNVAALLKDSMAGQMSSDATIKQQSQDDIAEMVDSIIKSGDIDGIRDHTAEGFQAAHLGQLALAGFQHNDWQESPIVELPTFLYPYDIFNYRQFPSAARTALILQWAFEAWGHANKEILKEDRMYLVLADRTGEKGIPMRDLAALVPYLQRKNAGKSRRGLRAASEWLPKLIQALSLLRTINIPTSEGTFSQRYVFEDIPTTQEGRLHIQIRLQPSSVKQTAQIHLPSLRELSLAGRTPYRMLAYVKLCFFWHRMESEGKAIYPDRILYNSKGKPLKDKKTGEILKGEILKDSDVLNSYDILSLLYGHYHLSSLDSTRRAQKLKKAKEILMEIENKHNLITIKEASGSSPKNPLWRIYLPSDRRDLRIGRQY